MAVMEPFDAFATTTDMDERTKGEITATSFPYLQRALDAASRLIRGECGWHVATAEKIQIRRAGRNRSEIWLPASQIVSIDSAIVDGTTVLTPADIEFDPETGWTNLFGSSYTIEFTAGYDDVPADILELTLQIAARSVGSPLGVIRERAGGVSIDYAAPGWMPGETAQLGAYRIGRLP